MGLKIPFTGHELPTSVKEAVNNATKNTKTIASYVKWLLPFAAVASQQENPEARIEEVESRWCNYKLFSVYKYNPGVFSLDRWFCSQKEESGEAHPSSQNPANYVYSRSKAYLDCIGPDDQPNIYGKPVLLTNSAMEQKSFYCIEFPVKTVASTTTQEMLTSAASYLPTSVTNATTSFLQNITSNSSSAADIIKTFYDYTISPVLESLVSTTNPTTNGTTHAYNKTSNPPAPYNKAYQGDENDSLSVFQIAGVGFLFFAVIAGTTYVITKKTMEKLADNKNKLHSTDAELGLIDNNHSNPNDTNELVPEVQKQQGLLEQFLKCICGDGNNPNLDANIEHLVHITGANESSLNNVEVV